MKSGRSNRRATSESQLKNAPTRPRTASTDTNTFGESASVIGTSTIGSAAVERRDEAFEHTFAFDGDERGGTAKRHANLKARGIADGSYSFCSGNRSIRSPAVPPNHQSSRPTTQIDVDASAELLLASWLRATTITSPATPGASSQESRPCASVLPSHEGASAVISRALSYA